MADRRPAGGAEIQHLLPRCNIDIVQTTENTSGQFASEGIPDPVLGLLAVRSLDSDALLAINGITWNEILGDEEMLLAFGDEDSWMAMGFEDDVRASFRSSTSTATTG